MPASILPTTSTQPKAEWPCIPGPSQEGVWLPLGTGTNAVTVTWNAAGAQTISVSYTNQPDVTLLHPTVKNVTVNALPVPTITGQLMPCVNSTNNIYTTESGNDRVYLDHLRRGMITAGTGTNAVTVTWNAAGAQTISVSLYQFSRM